MTASFLPVFFDRFIWHLPDESITQSMQTPRLKILVIGSSNTDLVVRTPRFPLAGETILGDEFFMTPGGKGANQAVAAVRLGGDVTFVTKIGKDVFGKSTLTALEREGIGTENVVETSEHPSGVAVITVDSKGENTIVVAAGANMQLLPGDISSQLIDAAEIILLQLEIPLSTIEYVVSVANTRGTPVVLNPAPAARLPDMILKGLFLITPNETEVETLTGIKPATLADLKSAANFLLRKGVKNVIITLGERGAFLMNEDHALLVPSPLVTPVDTTAAGDVFNGALITALANGVDLPQACDYACRAASISVTKRGAQTAAPYQNEL